jgi:membrane protein DedA with SNARE-associated domain
VSDGVWKYFATFGLLLAAGMGFPIPEEVPVVGGGIAAGHAANQEVPQHPYWFIMLPVCIIGVVVSDSILYSIGRFGGQRLLDRPWIQKHFVRPEKRQQIEDNFHKYGIKILLGARFLPGIRAPIFVMAGVLRLPIARFVCADGIYAIPGVSILFGLAYWYTDSFLTLFEHIHHKVGIVQHLIVVLVLSGVAGYFLYAFNRRRVATGDPHELPTIVTKILPHELDEIKSSESPLRRDHASNTINGSDSGMDKQPPATATRVDGISKPKRDA